MADEPLKNSEPLMQTYEDDLAKAMDTTDATTVQNLLDSARARESAMKDRELKKKQQGLYVIFSLIFLIFALGSAGYGVYNYLKLTVPVQKPVSVGVFTNTDPIIASQTDINQTINDLVANTSFVENKPVLVQLVSDEKSLSLLSNSDLFKFINTSPTEPFAASIDSLRLGVVNIGGNVTPFLIASVSDPETASQEFLNTEPDMLHMFYSSLNINLAEYLSEIGGGFKSDYLYNLPVRTLSATDKKTGTTSIVMLYGYVTQNTIVITTKPEVLKAIYDTIITQN